MPAWLIKFVVYAAIVATIAGFGFKAGYHYEKGKADAIETAWNTDKAARIQRTTEIVLQQVALRDKLNEELRESRNHVEVRTVTVVKEIPAALGPLASVRIPLRAVELYNYAAGAGPAPADSRAGGTPGAEAAATIADLETVCVQNAAEQLILGNQVRKIWADIDAYNAKLQGDGK